MSEPPLPPGIGPHEGLELELLLKQEKPVARFRLDGFSEEYERRFRDAVETGLILEFDFPDDQLHLHRRYYCLHGEEWRVKVMELVEHMSSECPTISFSAEDLHRCDGALLGYSKADIEAFLTHWRSTP